MLRRTFIATASALLLLAAATARSQEEEAGSVLARCRSAAQSVARGDPAEIAGHLTGPLREAYAALARLQAAWRGFRDAARSRSGEGSGEIRLEGSVGDVGYRIDGETVGKALTELNRDSGLAALVSAGDERPVFRDPSIEGDRAESPFAGGRVYLARAGGDWKVLMVSTEDAAAAERELPKLRRFAGYLSMEAEVAEALAAEVRGGLERGRVAARWQSLIAVAHRDHEVFLAVMGGSDRTHFRARDISDRGMEHLKGFTGLEDLTLKGCDRITDEGLARVSELRTLTEIDLEDCTGITDAGLAHLAGLALLEELSLEGCTGITDAGLRHLAGLAKLEKLDLAKCTALNGAGLEHLKGLTGLRILKLRGCTGITEEDVADLRRAIPGLEVR